MTTIPFYRTAKGALLIAVLCFPLLGCESLRVRVVSVQCPSVSLSTIQTGDLTMITQTVESVAIAHGYHLLNEPDDYYGSTYLAMKRQDPDMYGSIDIRVYACNAQTAVCVGVIEFPTCANAEKADETTYAIAHALGQRFGERVRMSEPFTSVKKAEYSAKGMPASE